MGATAAFDYDVWISRYPEFQDTVNQTMAETFFAEATIYHRNDGGGPVRNGASQLILLNMMTAHIAQLYVGTEADPASGGVGRVTNASEGSVSAGFQMDIPPGTPQWFNQTKYGASYWAATTPYRTMRYLPGVRRMFSPFPFR